MLYITIIIILILLLWYNNFGETDLTFVKGHDEDFHLVRNLSNKHMAADVMAEIKERLEKLIIHLKKTYPNNKDIYRLKNRYDEDNIRETALTDNGTSYSVDKGKEISICIRDKQTERIHSINLLMFVSIHEMAHIMSKTYGHNDEFLKNFIFLLKESVKIGIYNNIDYSRNKKEYCGIVVDSNPLF